MKRDDFERFARELQNDAWQVLKDKGADYARSDNAFHNFEATANFTGQTKEQVLGGHMYKHIAAIYRYIRDGKVDSEGLRGRAIDLINYVTFLVAMDKDGYDKTVIPPAHVSGWEREKDVDLAPGRAIFMYTNGPHKEDV